MVLVQEHVLQVLSQKANVTIGYWPQDYLDSNRTVGPAYSEPGTAVFSVEIIFYRDKTVYFAKNTIKMYLAQYRKNGGKKYGKYSKQGNDNC